MPGGGLDDQIIHPPILSLQPRTGSPPSSVVPTKGTVPWQHVPIGPISAELTCPRCLQTQMERGARHRTCRDRRTRPPDGEVEEWGTYPTSLKTTGGTAGQQMCLWVSLRLCANAVCAAAACEDPTIKGEESGDSGGVRGVPRVRLAVSTTTSPRRSWLCVH